MQRIFGNIKQPVMAGYSQRGGFTLTWKIENFAYCGMRTGEMLKTPFFNAYNSEWLLMLYPRGKDDSNYITVEFHRFGNNFDYLYSILDSEGTPLTWKEVKNVSSRNGHLNLARRDEVFGPRKSTFLPNCTLTIQCRILKTGEAFSSPLLYYVRSRIEENRNFWKWDILNFCSLDKRQQMAKDFPPLPEYHSYLNIKLCLDDDQRVQFNILRTKGASFDWGFATCKVVVLDTTGKKVMFAESEHFFESNNKLWQFTSYITKSMLMCDQSLFLPKGTLTLMFEYTLSSGIEFSYTEDLPATSINQEANSAIQPSKIVDKYMHQDSNGSGSPNSLSQDLLGLHESGILSDFNLRTGEKAFPVHKQVLSARSPVFTAMFTVAMKEKENEGIEIEDVDADTLQRMILFMYTDTVQDDMQWTEASKLYSVADRYELQSLKYRCATFLKESVCESNVCEVLALADLHQDVDLKSTSFDFILQHDTQVIGTERWKKFEKENVKLSFETFRELYMKKMNKE